MVCPGSLKAQRLQSEGAPLRGMELPRNLVQESARVARERAPDLQVERIGPGAPQRYVRLCQHGARAHADRKLAYVQIERACASQNHFGMRPAHLERELPMAHVDERMRRIAQGVFDCGRGRARVLSGEIEQEGFIRTEP